MDKVNPILYSVMAQVNWEVKPNNYLPKQYMVTFETVTVKGEPTKGSVLAALEAEVEKGQQVPGPAGATGKPISIYGEFIEVVQVSGELPSESGETPKRPEGLETK